jgi:hypothetical protein
MLFAAAGIKELGIPQADAVKTMREVLSQTVLPKWYWRFAESPDFGAVYDEVARLTSLEPHQLMKNLQFRYSMLPVPQLTSAQATALRILLLMGGVEPNPGPKGDGPSEGLAAAIDAAIPQDKDPFAPATEQPVAAPKGERPKITIVRPGQPAHDGKHTNDPPDAAAEVKKEEESNIPAAPNIDGQAQDVKEPSKSGDAPSPERKQGGRNNQPNQRQGLTRSEKKRLRALRRRHTRGARRDGAIQRQLVQEVQQAQGERDALREMVQAPVRMQEQQVQEQAHAEEVIQQLRDLQDQVEEAQRLGFIPRNGVARTYAFNGHFSRDGASTFRSGGGDFSYVTTDEVVTVNVGRDGVWETDASGFIFRFRVNHTMLTIAARSIPTASKEIRMRNIYAAFQQATEIKTLIRTYSDAQLMDYMQSVELIAFCLTGILTSAGSLKWMNDCEEWVLQRYIIKQTDLPPDWQERIADVNIHDDTLAFQASVCRNCRAAPIVLENCTPAVPDPSHLYTLIAAMLKRMYPKLSRRSRETLQELNNHARDLVEHIEDHFDPNIDAVPDEILLDRALRGRNAAEAAQIRRGWERARDDPREATDWYCTLPYKCFIKLEAYPEGSFKPPRFIQSLDPEARGVQLFFMAGILHKIEVGTAECNVKGLTPEQITHRLIDKFENLDLVGESDFGAFECSLGPDFKASVENFIFEELADTDAQRAFIRQALGRETVNVIGPVFNIPHYHHCRMSGDLWTSIGNLISNIVLTAFVNEWTVEHTIAVGLFEGDDAVYPAPDDVERVKSRGTMAGVILELKVAPWEALSFCGNHFEQCYDGSLLRCRDPMRAVVNSTILFNAPRGTRKYDLMLQRSKCICYLQYPWIPDAFVFFCVVERFTRGAQVSPDILQKFGLLKEYSGYAVESCVPDWLVYNASGAYLSDNEFIDKVYKRNCDAGGHCSRDVIVEMVRRMRAANGKFAHVKLPSPMSVEGNGSWFARDGARFTHVCTSGVVPFPCVNNVRADLTPETRSVPLRSFHEGALGRGVRMRAEQDKKGKRPVAKVGLNHWLECFKRWLYILAGGAIGLVVGTLIGLFISWAFGVGYFAPTPPPVLALPQPQDQHSWIYRFFIRILVALLRWKVKAEPKPVLSILEGVVLSLQSVASWIATKWQLWGDVLSELNATGYLNVTFDVKGPDISNCTNLSLITAEQVLDFSTGDLLELYSEIFIPFWVCATVLILLLLCCCACSCRCYWRTVGRLPRLFRIFFVEALIYALCYHSGSLQEFVILNLFVLVPFYLEFLMWEGVFRVLCLRV